MSRLPPRIARLTARLAAPLPALALAAAALATARFQLDPGAAATTAFFGWLALGVLGALALPPRQPPALPAAAALAVGLALLGLPHLGVLRPAATMALLAAAVLAHGAALQRRSAALGPGAWLALALAAQLVADGERLFLAPTAAATAGAPARAAARGRGRRDRARTPVRATRARRPPRRSRSSSAAPAGRRPASPRWPSPRSPPAPSPPAPARATVAHRRPGLGPSRARRRGALARARRVRRDRARRRAGRARPAPHCGRQPRGARASRAGRGGAPWRRSAPATTLLTAALGPGGRVATRPVEMQPVVLAAGSPRFETALDGGTITAVVVDSYLTRSLDLPCGTAVARLRVELDGAAFEAPLEVGRDSAEWAADRADVAAALACPPPAPLTSWLPAGDRFLGHHFRARLRLDRPVAARRLVIERPAELPAATALAIFHVAVER